MLIQPTLPDHPKFIALKAAIGPCAMEVLVRLWGYAQTAKSACLGRVDAAYIKAITRYGGAKDKLWQALAMAQVGGKAGWLDVHDDGTVWVHGFDEYNKNLNASRENGRAVGKSTGLPTGLPKHNPQAHPQGGNELNRMNGTELNEYVTRLNTVFKRIEGDSWSYLEEHTLADLIKRPGFAAELGQIEAYRAGLPPDRIKFFPQTLSNLLTRWTEVLDRAKGEQGQKKNAPPLAQKKDGDLDLWWTETIANVELMRRGLLLGGDAEKAARVAEILTIRKGAS